jgi:hypothetical protein
MGLDVTHYKLTHSPKDLGDYLTLEGWDFDCNVPISNYKNYITDIEEYNLYKSILIVKNNNDLEKLKNIAFTDLDSYMHIFVGEENAAMQEKIENYVKKHQLHNLERNGLNIEHNNIEYSSILFSRLETVKGVYFNEVGYQRKSMNAEFYKKFNRYLWGKKEDFELAYNCIESKLYYKEARAHFKTNFLDTFEFGKSLLCASF